VIHRSCLPVCITGTYYHSRFEYPLPQISSLTLISLLVQDQILWSQITKQASLLLICWMLEAFLSFSKWVALH